MVSNPSNQPVPDLVRLPWFLCLALGIYVASVCCRIEGLNAEAGYRVPRRELIEGDNPKWRAPLVHDDETWIQFRRLTKNGEPDRSPLTADEQKKMQADVRQARAENELLELIGGQGLLQYPLAMIAGVWSLFLLGKRRDRHLLVIAMTTLVLALMSLWFAFHRGYYTSLG